MSSNNLKDLLQSDEELFFYYWIEELKSNGYITNYILQPEPILLSEAVPFTWIKDTSTKTIKGRTQEVQGEILKAAEYTPDCLIYWSDKALNVFHTPDKPKSNKCNLLISHSNTSYVEVKPSNWDFQSMTRLFITKQKWIYQKHGIYVNLIAPVKLFEKMFTPNKYLLTPTGKPKKIKFKVRSLEEYIKLI